MKSPFFTGACTALVTPFLQEQINYPMLQILLQRQIDAGLEAVVICGTTGESPTLSDREKLELFTKAQEFSEGRIKIIAGTGSNDTLHTVELSLAAQEAGADGLLVVSPYYNKATPEGLYRHYLSVAHAVRIPIIIYNVPSRTAVDIPVSVYKRLSKVPNIVGVKEASTDIKKVLQIYRECGEDLTVWTGNDDMILPAIAMGAQGVISVASNVFPDKIQALTDLCLDGDLENARKLQSQLLPLMEALFREVNPIPVKAAMASIGLDCGRCRPPLTEATNETVVALKALLT